MNARGKLVILSGPSGVGKTTVADRVLESGRVERVVTATTRAPRPDEQDGVDYEFLTRDEFERRIRAGRFLEYASVHSGLYGTPRETVEDGLGAGKLLLLNIDVQGARQIRSNAAGLEAVSIFLLPPGLEELERRLRRRETETEEEIRSRLTTATEELAEQDYYDHKVVNDDVDRAASRILAVLDSLSGGAT